MLAKRLMHRVKCRYNVVQHNKILHMVHSRASYGVSFARIWVKIVTSLQWHSTVYVSLRLDEFMCNSDLISLCLTQTWWVYVSLRLDEFMCDSDLISLCLTQTWWVYVSLRLDEFMCHSDLMSLCVTQTWCVYVSLRLDELMCHSDLMSYIQIHPGLMTNICIIDLIHQWFS